MTLNQAWNDPLLFTFNMRDLQEIAASVCSRIESWLTAKEAQSAEPCFCDKEALNAQLCEALAHCEKKERKRLVKEFDSRRQRLESDMAEVARTQLPLFGELADLHAALQPAGVVGVPPAGPQTAEPQGYEAQMQAVRDVLLMAQAAQAGQVWP